METKAKLPKKLLSMFLAVLMAFSCFSLVMPELVPEANAATADYTALKNAFKAAYDAGLLRGSNAAMSGTTITDSGDQSYLFNIAEALIAVIKAEHANGAKHNLRLRSIIIANCNSNPALATTTTALSGPQQDFINKLLPSSGDYNTYPLQQADGSAGAAHTVTTGWNCNSAPADPAAPAVGSAFSVTVERSTTAAILDDYTSVYDVPSDVVTKITVTFTPGHSYTLSTGSQDHTTGSGCDASTHTDYNRTRATRWQNNNVQSSTASAAHGVDFSAIKNYLSYVTTDAQFVADYNSWVTNNSVVYGWDYDKLNTVLNDYDDGGAFALKTWAEKANTPNSLFVTKFIPNKAAEKGYDAFIAAVSSTIKAASYKKYVDWIMSDTAFGEYPQSSAYDKASDLAENREQMVYLRQLATDFKKTIDDEAGMAQTLTDMYGYDQNAYQNYIDLLTDYIEQYDLRQVKYVSDFRTGKNSSETYANPYDNAPGMSFFGIADHVSYPFTQMDPPQECPVSDDMLEMAYQDYETYISIINGMQDENVTAVFGADGEQKIINTKNDLRTELNFRERALEFGNYAKYFEEIKTTDWTEKTSVYIEDKIVEAKSTVTALTSLYNTTVSQIGTEKAQQIFGNYIEETAKKAAIDDTLYQTLYVRSYNQLAYVKEVRSTGVNASNFSLVKRAIKLVDNDLYKYITETTGVGEYYTQAEIDALKAMYDLLDDYQAEVDAQQAKVWEFARQNLEVSGTDYYTIREAVDQDMVRDPNKDAHDYVVNSKKVNEVIDKIDKFVSSKDFTQLLGMYDEEAGVETLSQYISKLLQEELFNDKMINTLISMLFPMLANLIVNDLKGMLGNLGDLGTTPTDPSADAAINLGALGLKDTVIAADVAILGDVVLQEVQGTLNLYLDGNRGSLKFVDLAKQLGLNIFPDVLSTVLGQTPNASKYASIRQTLTAAGTNWIALDADGDGELSPEDLEAKGFVWDVHDYDSFVAVIGDIFSSVLPVLQTLFTKNTFSKTVSYSNGIILASCNNGFLDLNTLDLEADIEDLQGKATSATLTISPLSGYNNIWGALFEAFGVTNTTSSYNVTLDAPLSTTFGTSGSSATAAQFANALFMPIMSLIDTLAQRPIYTLTGILPNLTQALSYNLLQPLLDELVLNLNLNVDLEITTAEIDANFSNNVLNFTLGWLIDLIEGALDLPGILNDNIPPFDFPIEFKLAEQINLEELIGCDITDLNAIIEMIFATAIEDLAVEGIDAIDIPTFNTGLVSRLGNLNRNASSIREKNYNYSNAPTKTRYTIEADRADVFYYLIQWVIDFIAEGNNLSRLLQLLDMGTLDASITQLLGNIDAENALAALCELFVPQDPQYEMAEYNWYQPNSPQSVYNFAGADFVYLKYANNWTLEKAEYVFDNLDGIINTIIEMIDPEMLEGYENGVSDLFLEKVLEIFNNEGIGGFLKLLIDLGSTLAGQDEILGLLERDFGIDLTIWYNTFGYLFSEYYGEEEVEKEPEEGEVVDPDAEPEMVLVPFGPPTPADGQYGKPGVDYGTYEDLFPLLEVEVIETKEPQLDEDGNPQYDEDNNQLFNTKYEYKFIYNGEELVDGSENARHVFADIFTYLVQPLAPLFELLLTGKDLTLFNGAITFNGADAYNGALLPVFEAIGLEEAPTFEEYKAMCEDDSNGVDGATKAFNYLVDILFDYVTEFLEIETLADGTVYGPFQKIVELIPNIVYFLQSGGLSTLLKNLLHSIWVLVDTVRPIVDLDIDDFIHQFLCQFLELTYDKSEYGSSDIVNLLMDLISPDYVAPEYSEEAAAEDKETVDNIYNITIEDLSLPVIFDLLKALVGIDFAPLTYAIEGMSFPYTRTIDGTPMIFGVQSFESKTGTTAGRSIGYGPDVITVLISAILDLLRYGDNAAAIDGLLGFVNDNTEEDITGDITATGILEVLLTVFEDKVGVEYEQPNWDYLLEGKYVADESGNEHAWVDGDYDTLAVASDFSRYHTLRNLDYLTDWTETTAQITEAEFSGLLDFVASQIDADYDDLGAFLNDLIEDNLFTADNLKAVVDGIAQLYDFLPEDILELIDELLDIDLTSWLAYVEEVDATDDDGNAIKKHVAKADHEWWADATAEAYVDSKEEFLAAFETLLHGVDTLVGLIFLGEDYKLFHTMGGGQGEPDHGSDAIVLDGFSAYGYTLAPIFEALGYTVEKGNLKPTSYYVVENADGTVTYKSSELITDVMNLVVDVVDDIAEDPAKWIIDVLPGLTYFINANGLASSISNILNSVNEILDAVNSILGEDQQIDLSALLGDIDLSNLTMGALLKFVEDLGIYINPALANIVADFYMGDVVVFDAANGNRAFTMTYTDVEQRHDMVTVLLAFLLEVVTDAGEVTDENGNVYTYDNAAAIDALIAGEDGENTGIVSAIVKAVHDPDSVIYGNIDWGYMYETIEKLEDRTNQVSDYGFPEETFKYLEYSTDWTEDTAAAVYAELNNIIGFVLGEFTEADSIAKLLEGILNDNVYTDGNLKIIVELIVNALSGVNESLRKIIGAVVTADIGAWFDMCDETTDADGKTVYVLKDNYFGVDSASDKKQAFIDGIMEIIQPANRLLAWLFFGDTYTFFTSTTNEPLITLQGGLGYAEGLVPILEALGLEMEPASNFYVSPLDGSEGYYNAALAVQGVLESVLGLVDKISANPSKEALALIPNLLYFINADGLKTSVTNLVAPIDNVLRSLESLVGGASIAELLAETIGFDLNDLSTETVLAILADEELVGFKVNDAMAGVINKIYALGVADEFTSANGKQAFRVDITGKEDDVLTVILSFALDAFNYNDALFADLLGAETYTAVKTLLAGVEALYKEADWGYMYEGDTVAERLEALAADEDAFPAVTFKYLEYSTDWTEDAAKGVYSSLDEILDLVLPSVLGDNENLKVLVEGILDEKLYTTEIVEALVELIVNALAGFDASLGNAVGALLDADISTWFEMCELVDVVDENGITTIDENGNVVQEYKVIPGTFVVNDKASFITAIKTVLEPANKLLSWLFFGGEYTFFNGTTNDPLITLKGGYGYAYGLVPIFEALGVTMQPASAFYNETTKTYNVGAAVESILNGALGLLDNLAASESTVRFAFKLIPNLLYFINADGLTVSVGNLLAPVNAIILALSDVVGAESLEALLKDVIGFDLSDLGMDAVIALLEDEELVGFKMNGDMKQALKDIYGLGDAASFTSANGKTAYKLDITNREYDVLTVILSFALDAFNYNPVLFSDLLGEDIYNTVYNLIRGATSDFEYKGSDWGYMFEGDTVADRLAALKDAGTGINKYLPEYADGSIAADYLQYANNWNEETAEYVVEAVDMLVQSFFESDSSLAKLLDDAITNGLYQDSILNSLLETVVGLIVDYAEIIENAGALLGAESISKWFYDEETNTGYVKIIDGEAVCVHDFGIDEAETYEEKRTLFVEAFVDVLEPAYRLLAWLLFAEDFTFFNGTTNDPLITLTGGRGYAEGLVPLLEAVGAKMPGKEGNYLDGKSAIWSEAHYRDADDNLDMEAVVRDVFSALTGWLSDICGDLANPGEYGVITAMLERLPNFIYNLNAGTLDAIVCNLLLPVEEILGHLKGFGVEVDIHELLADLGLTSYDWYGVFALVEKLVNLYWPANIQEFLATLYLGKVVEYDSASGEKAYYMTYVAKDETAPAGALDSTAADMTTLLISFVLDGFLDTRNKEQLVKWFGNEDIYNVIYKYLTGAVEKVKMQEFSWILTEYANSGKPLSPITLGGFNGDYMYGELYTREMGEYINKWLPSFVDTMIVLLGVEAEDGTVYDGLEDILDTLIGDTIYTKANLDAILGMLQDLLPTLKEELGEELYEIIYNVAIKALGIDIKYWDNYTVADFSDGDRDTFVSELVRMLRPAYPILGWLLTDEDLIALFHVAGGRDAVVIEGAQGYAYGIVPLLEAFDYDSDLILDPDAYKAAAYGDPDDASDDNLDALLENILNPLLDVVDQVLADPVNEIFNVLPGIIYFLNSNGLDTVIKNTANAVFTVLEAIEPLTGELDIYELIGFDAAELNINTLIDELLKGVEEDTGFQLSETALEAITGLTVGEVITIPDSKNGFAYYEGKEAYTMKYATGADRVDMVTIILRAVLTFVSIPENVVALEAILADSLTGDGYTFLCSLLENFSQMAASEDGMDEIMYTVYQIFYAANVAAHKTNDWYQNFNGDYSFLNQLFATSDLAFLRQIEISLGDLLNKYTGDIVDDDEIAPNGFIKFFQKIAEFFQKIADFFKNLFK